MLNLLWLLIIPLIGSFIVFLLGSLRRTFLRNFSIGLSFIPLLMLVLLHQKWIGQEIQLPWLSALHINFRLAVEGVSLIFLYLTAIIIPLSLIVSSKTIPMPSFFYGLVLLLEALLIGFFTARDLVVFTIFWEAMLIPLYFIIAYWGGPKRREAAFKFLLYMLAGSALMIVAVLGLYLGSSATGNPTFDLNGLKNVAEQTPYSIWFFAIFALAFAVKTPLFPFHAWLPETYYQASMSGTILLSAILSKAGIYGFYRICIELFPAAMQTWGFYLAILAFIGVFYGGLVAWRQNDYKLLISYSSLSHVNFILVGLFVWNDQGHVGAILQAFNHGIIIAGLFIVTKWLAERIGSTSIQAGSGLAQYLPNLCWLTLVFVLASVALPGTNGFIGELLILFGLFKEHYLLASFLCLTVILSVVYMLRWMEKMYFGLPSEGKHVEPDIGLKQIGIALPLIILIIWIGVYPTPLIKLLERASIPTNQMTAFVHLEEK